MTPEEVRARIRELLEHEPEKLRESGREMFAKEAFELAERVHGRPVTLEETLARIRYLLEHEPEKLRESGRQMFAKEAFELAERARGSGRSTSA